MQRVEPSILRALPLLCVTVSIASGVGLTSTRATAQYGSDQSLFSIPRSQDDVHQVRTADVEIRDGKYRAAVERLHALMLRGRKGLFEVGPGLYLGMRTAIIRRLRDLPQAGLSAYEKLAQREAGRLAKTAFVGRNVDGLETLAGRYPTSIAGRQARLRLGDLWLEAGDGSRASTHYIRLLQAMSTKDPKRSMVALRLRLAQTLVTRRSSGSVSRTAHRELLDLSSDPNAGIGWRAYAGGLDGTSPMDLPKALGTDQLSFQMSSPGYGSYYPLTVHATGGLNGLYFNTGHQVICFDPIAARNRWVADGPMVGSHESGEYYDTLSREMLLSVAVSPDVIVAALQVPNTLRSQQYHNLDLLYKLPTRRLFAFDRHTGKRLWAHWDFQAGPRSKIFVSHNAPAPPIIDGDTVYAATNDPTGAISYYLSAYELKTGEPKWRTLICSSQGEVNMFGNAKIEYAATPVALHEGILYGTTNLGLCYAVDAATGRARWCSSYPIIPLPTTRLRGQAVRSIFFANNPVVVSHGVMVSTPLDSEHVIAMDIESGEILWKLHWKQQATNMNNLKWMLGVLGDEVILTGNGVVAAKLRPRGGRGHEVRQIKTPHFFGMNSRIARGAITDGHIVQPVGQPEGGRLSVFDRQGNSYSRPFDVKDPGNILMVDGLVVSARANTVKIHLDLAGLMHQAQLAIDKEPGDPANYLRLATLMRGSKGIHDLTGVRGDRLVKLLRRGIVVARKAGLGNESPLLRSLSTELFKISLKRADRETVRGATDRARKILAGARDDAMTPDEWITAQMKILVLLESSKKGYLEELTRLAETHPDAKYGFPGVGTMQVRPWVLWRSIPYVSDQAEAVARCQELLENHFDVVLPDENAGTYALRTIQARIDKHGRDVYAKIEARAASRLELAGSDVVLLREVDQRFPHSLSAAAARNLVLDQAVLRGDLATAATMASRTVGELTPGMLRRLMIAAGKAGNAPLAASLGARLLREFGDTESDFPPDAGAKMSAVVEIPALPEAKRTYAHLPSHRLEGSIKYRARSPLDVLQTRTPTGYGAPDRRLLYAASGISELVAYDVAKSRTEPVFAVKARLRLHVLSPDEPIRLCENRMILNEESTIRCLHNQTGEEIWSHPASKDRTFQIVAVQSGVIQAFSTLSNHGDGGTIVGLDTLSGAQLYHRSFPTMREVLMPKGFLGDLWTLSNPPGTSDVEVHRIDGITGNLRHRFKLSGIVQSKLGLKPDRSGDVRLRTAHGGLLVDESSIYICAGDARGKPVVVAFEHGGRVRWSWASSAARAMLKVRALHDAGLVLFEVVTTPRPTSSRVIVINKKSGLETRSTKLSGSARVLSQQPEPFAPDLLLLQQNDQSTSLVGYSIAGDGPSFRYNTNQRRNFWRWYPIVSKDFLAAPYLDSSGVRMKLLVVDLAHRRGALPEGKNFQPLPDRGPGYRVMQHGPYILCQTREGILVFGNERDSK